MPPHPTIITSSLQELLQKPLKSKHRCLTLKVDLYRNNNGVASLAISGCWWKAVNIGLVDEKMAKEALHAGVEAIDKAFEDDFK